MIVLMIRFVDDIVMIVESQRDIKRVVNKVFGLSEIKINSAKIKI